MLTLSFAFLKITQLIPLFLHHGFQINLRFSAIPHRWNGRNTREAVAAPSWSAQGQVGGGSEHTGLVEGVPAIAAGWNR